MDKEESWSDESIEIAIGYAGAVGTSLWSEIREDRSLGSPGYGVSMLTG
jgi:hypothetical protein